MVNIMSDYPSSWTCRARLQALTRLPRNQLGIKRSRAKATRWSLENLIGASFADKPSVQNQVRMVNAESWNTNAKEWCEWDPYVCPVVRKVRQPQGEGAVCAFTDGSTAEPGEPSGCGIVITTGRCVSLVHKFACRASGNNYLCELVAILSATQAVPSNVLLTIVTDCLAGIFGINKGRIRNWVTQDFTSEYALPQRARILSAARPILNMIRAVIAARESPTRFRHVRSHTGGDSFDEEMNDRADVEANSARRHAIGQKASFPLQMYGEEGHRMSLQKVPVIGAFKPAMLRCMRRNRTRQWIGRAIGQMPAINNNHGADTGPLIPNARHSSRIIAANAGGVDEMSRTVKSTRDPWLMRFWVLAVAEWLPTERRLGRKNALGEPSRGEACKLCGAEVETCRHLLSCTYESVRAQWCRVRSDTSTITVLRGAGLRVTWSQRRPAGHGLRIRTRGGRDCITRWVPLWFARRSNFWLQILSPYENIDMLVQPTDAWASALGVLPEEINQLLWGQKVNGRWQQRQLRDLAKLKEQIQLSLLRGVHETWRIRCRAMGSWWASPTTATFVADRITQRERIGRKRCTAQERARERAFNTHMKRVKSKRQKRDRRRRQSNLAHALQAGEEAIPLDELGVLRVDARVVVYWKQQQNVRDGWHRATIAQVIGNNHYYLVAYDQRSCYQSLNFVNYFVPGSNSSEIDSGSWVATRHCVRRQARGTSVSHESRPKRQRRVISGSRLNASPRRSPRRPAPRQFYAPMIGQAWLPDDMGQDSDDPCT